MKKSPAKEQPLFERMGSVYKLLVDETARRRREEPLLLEVAARARSAGGARKRPAASTRVLDLACGTGFHARILADAGYAVEALDASESLLAEAAKLSRGAGRIAFRRADLLEPLPVARPAALALLLGNTLSLFHKPRELGRVLRNVADALAPGGLLLCQILNFERLRRRGSVVTARHGDIEGRETSLSKTLQAADDGSILIHLAAAQRAPGGEWESFSKAEVMNPLEPTALKRAARRAGLALDAEWGDMTKGAFDRAESSDYVAMFARR